MRYQTGGGGLEESLGFGFVLDHRFVMAGLKLYCPRYLAFPQSSMTAKVVGTAACGLRTLFLSFSS